jgi:hypothetical protein
MNRVKNVAGHADRYLLPLLGTVYFLLGEFRCIPLVSEIMGAIIICDLILGILLAFGDGFDGDLLIDRSDPEKDIYRLDLGENLEKLGEKRSIRLKVDNDAKLR